MQHDITKLCADSLRATTLEKYGVKLKPTHAHELGAAFFGYPSKNAMLADTKYPISNLHQAKIVVMAPDEFIDQRRTDMEGLSPELPDSYSLGEGVYDLSKPNPPEDAYAFYRDYVMKANGPILEPMCGTGRFLLPLLAEGFNVHGFDASSHMLKVLHAKAKTKNLDATVCFGKQKA